jgi:hypothetical protein
VALYKIEAMKALKNQDVSQVVYAAAVAILSEISPFEYPLFRFPFITSPLVLSFRLV